jgi:hypothetical protein
MKKQILSFGLVVLAVVLIVLAFVFWPKSENGTNNLSNSKCNPYLNISSTAKSGDVKNCDCLADASQIKLCQTNVSNITSYTNALQKSELSQCDNIGDIGMKAACQKIIQGKIDFAKRNITQPATSSNKQ